MIGLFARKVGMAHIYNEDNRHIPVTILEVPTQIVTGLRSVEKNGYAAVQIGCLGRKKVAKPQRTELKGAKIDLAIATRAELPLPGETLPSNGLPIEIGQHLTPAVFSPGDKIAVTAMSKGKGFAGTIKRHGFHRGPQTHGSHNVRRPGSIGSGFPQRVIPGRRMAGHLGHKAVTVRGLTVVAIDQDRRTIAVSGAIPGAKRGLILVRKITQREND